MTELIVPEIAAARSQLRELLKDHGFLRPSLGQPVTSFDGDPASWMLYSWNITLTFEGATLAAICLLDRLRDFESVQLASVGYTGLPILTACIMEGRGRYSGISVREGRKQHGSMRRVDGCGDRTRPVVVIDDSMVSGRGAISAIEALEAEGFQVEGVLCLVNFPWGEGLQYVSASGYRVEYVFDIVKDLDIGEGAYQGFNSVVPNKWDDPPIENGLHPAIAARKTAERYLTRGSIPAPPQRFDREYNGLGGVFVSFRERDTNLRQGRSGYWHFDPGESDPCRDVVLATIATLQENPEISLEILRFLKIGVSFLGPLEQIPPGKLDFSKFGIVVRSKAGDRLGGALPNTEYFIGEIEQYRHARWVNALITEHEPHEIFAHIVQKVVEPGAYWLPFGASHDPNREWTTSDLVGNLLTSRARNLLKSVERGGPPRGDPLPDDLIPAPIYAVGVTLFRKGYVGCALAWGETLDTCIQRAVDHAFRDDRFPTQSERATSKDVAVSVSILHDQGWLGQVELAVAAEKLRRGLDSISVEYQGGGDMLLPFVFVYDNLTKEEAAEVLLTKAGDPDPPLSWAIYPTATWLERNGKLSLLRFGFPDRSEEPYTERMLKKNTNLLAQYLMRHLRDDGLPGYQYDPIYGNTTEDGPAARLIHALWALNEAGSFLDRKVLCRAGQKGLRRLLEFVSLSPDGKATLRYPEQESEPLADSLLLIALCSAGADLSATDQAVGLARNVRSTIRSDGRITDMPQARGIDLDHDYLPGIVILALARYAETSGNRDFTEGLAPALNYYRRRFRLIHPWGMVGWHPQAWAALHRVTGDAQLADFVFEICDWTLTMQHEKSGAFLCDLTPEGFSFHTAFVSEALAVASLLAWRLGMAERRERYRKAYEQAFRFMNRLIIVPDDTFCMRDPNLAEGGVREALFLSSVRIDFVSHTLLAMVNAQKRPKKNLDKSLRNMSIVY